MVGESELILNPDGSVYHLHLKPEDIAPNIITVGDPGRVDKVSRYFDRIELRKEKREFITHTGYLADKRITVISTGIGTDNMDIVISEIYALDNIDLLLREPRKELRKLSFIRVGTSGSLQREIQVGSIIASEFALGLDNLMTFYNTKSTEQETELLNSFEKFMRDSGLPCRAYVAACSGRRMQHLQPPVVRGITVTSPGFYGPQGRMLRKYSDWQRLPDVLGGFRYGERSITNFEMETSALYGLAGLLGHDALSLSVVIANRAEKKFSSEPDALVDSLIRFSLDLIREQG